ncbi:DNA topoisomerase I, mitochondrial-like, partial [Pipra filicauda]|uniref:DNA topoisomerase I, mitochondrial-like n=1 Tax=Pipra filicauda TaxID=649802 RepID=A0A7R5L1V0_9PASS
MGVSRDSGMKKSSRKRKKELEKGQEVPKELRTKIGKKEPERSVQFPVGKGGKGKKKKKPPEVEEKPLQENVISSSLKQEAAGGKGLGSSLWNGIQAEEGAAPGSEETKGTLPQGPSVELQDSSGSQAKPREAGPAVGQQLLESQNGIGARKEDEKEVENKWKWWEEEKKEDGVKWTQLEHRGPYFAPLYEPLPEDVRFYYAGKPLKLSLATEEIATFYAKMLDHEYTTKEIFQNNFFHDWRKEMTSEEQEIIQELAKCDFSEIHKYFVDKSEARKALPKEEKQKLKEEADKIQEEYGYCILDGHREKIGNFKTEPPGLFRGRGDHPKMGMLKKRIMPEDVIINCSRDSKIPEPPEGHKWKEVRFDNTVTWLASWTENIQNTLKYIMLNPSSKLK